MALDREQEPPAKAKPKAGPTKARPSEGVDRQATKTAALALAPYAAASGKRHAAESIEISRDPENQSPAIGQTVVYRVNLPVNGKYRWRVDRGSGFEIEHPVVSQLKRTPNEWAITWSQAGEYEVICDVLYLPQPREGHPVPFTVKADVRVTHASNVAHEAVMNAVAKADGAASYEGYHKQREREHAEMTGKGASPFANETSDASDPFIGAMPINGPAVLEGKSHDQTYVLNYWKGDPATLKWMVIPRSPDSKGQRLIRLGHGAAPTFSFSEPGLYDVVCTQRVAKQSRTGVTNEEFVPVTATVQAILSANGKAQADELRKKIAHADALIAKIAKDPETHQSRAVAITGVHVAALGNKVDHLPLFIGPSAEHSSEFVVVDLRPGIARSEHVGSSPEAALQAYEAFAEKNYPKGSVNLHISANSEHIAPQQRSFDTQSKLHWDHVGEQIGWISLGLVVSGLGLMAAGVTAPVGMIMLGAAAAGTIAGAATLKGHIDEGATAKQYTIDVMQLAAGLVGFRAFGNLAAYAMQVPNVAKSMIAVEFGLNSGSIGLMSTDVAEELVKVNADASLSEDERDTRRWQIALNMLGQAGFFWLGYRGAKNDFKITNQVRVVRPDELARNAATPRKHQPDINEAAPTRRRAPRRRGDGNAARWAGHNVPVASSQSSPQLYVLRHGKEVPVTEVAGDFYDPKKKKINLHEEEIVFKMAGGSPEVVDDIDADYAEVMAYFDTHKIDDRDAHIYKKFMHASVYGSHGMYQEAEHASDASEYLDEIRSMAIDLKERLNGKINLTGDFPQELSLKPGSAPSIERARETLNRIDAALSKNQMTLAEYHQICDGYQVSFGYGGFNGAENLDGKFYNGNWRRPFRPVIERRRPVSVRQINDMSPVGVGLAERLHPTEYGTADATKRDARGYRYHDYGHHITRPDMPTNADDFLKQSVRQIAFYRGFEQLRAQKSPNEQELLDLVWFDLTHEGNLSFFSVAEVLPESFSVQLTKDQDVSDRILRRLMQDDPKDYQLSYQAKFTEDDRKSIQDAVKLVRQYAEQRMATAPAQAKQLLNFHREIIAKFADPVWLGNFNFLIAQNSNDIPGLLTPRDYLAAYSRLAGQITGPAMKPLTLAERQQLQDLMDLARHYEPLVDGPSARVTASLKGEPSVAGLASSGSNATTTHGEMRRFSTVQAFRDFLRDESRRLESLPNEQLLDESQRCLTVICPYYFPGLTTNSVHDLIADYRKGGQALQSILQNLKSIFASDSYIQSILADETQTPFLNVGGTALGTLNEIKNGIDGGYIR